MVQVAGVDHLVLSVGDFETSKAFYVPLMEFLGFGVEAEYEGMMGWANGKTLFWIARVKHFVLITKLKTHQASERVIIIHYQHFFHLLGSDWSDRYRSRKFGDIVFSRRWLHAAIEHLARLPNKNVFGKWFVQEMNPLVQNSVTGNKAVGIA